MLYVCADGGGTKLQLLAFDERLRLLAQARGPGITTHYIPAETVRRNILAACRRLLEALPPEVLNGPGGLPAVDCLFETYCSGMAPSKLLGQLVTLRDVRPLDEGVCGLLAGAGQTTGVLTLSGTGSDCFFVEAGETRCLLGGWGPVLGDEASGYDLGRQALVAAVQADEGRGAPTLLRDYVFADYGLQAQLRELVGIVYGAPDTRREVARATYTLGRAARDGDAVARRILTDGGRRLAQDTGVLLRRFGQGADCRLPVTVSGGAWKIHPLLWQTYRETLLADWPQLRLQPPLFEPVMGGVLYTVLQQEGALSPARLEGLQREFAAFRAEGAFAQS